MCADIHTSRKKKFGHARPLRRESLARLRRQPAAVDAEVQVEEGVKQPTLVKEDSPRTASYNRFLTNGVELRDPFSKLAEAAAEVGLAKTEAKARQT